MSRRVCPFAAEGLRSFCNQRAFYGLRRGGARFIDSGLFILGRAVPWQQERQVQEHTRVVEHEDSHDPLQDEVEKHSDHRRRLAQAGEPERNREVAFDGHRRNGRQGDGERERADVEVAVEEINEEIRAHPR